jgi:putative iron-regulated protein
MCRTIRHPARCRPAPSLAAARVLDEAVAALVAAPSEATLQAAREAWLAARVPYQQTEVYRFGNTPRLPRSSRRV